MRQTYPHELVAARRSEIRRIVERHGCSNPRVFGSAARGSDRYNSDIDIIIDPGEKTGLFGLAALYAGYRSNPEPDRSNTRDKICMQFLLHNDNATSQTC